MKILLPIFCAFLVSVSAPAQGVYNMAKQQAKNVANGESPQAGATSPQYNPQPVTPDPALQATLRNINNLRVDFENFDSSPTNTLPLTKDLTEAAQGAKPASAHVNTLAQDLASTIAGNKRLHPQHQKLAQFVHALFNSSHLSPAQQQTVLDSVKKILTDGGVPADDVAKVITDLKAIATETK